MAMYIPVADRARYKKMLPREKKEYRATLRKKREEASKKGVDGRKAQRTLQKEEKIQKAKEETKSVAEMQGEIQGLLAKHEIDPLEELLIAYKRRGKGSLPMKEKTALMKFLMPYIHATKKSIDVQQDLKMSVSVSLQSFRDASQEALNVTPSKVIADDEYAEFEEKLIDGESSDSDEQLET